MRCQAIIWANDGLLSIRPDGTYFNETLFEIQKFYSKTWVPAKRRPFCLGISVLTVYASVNWTSIGSGNGLSPVRRQAITWAIVDLLSIGPLGTNFSEIYIKIQTFHSWKCIWKCRLRNGVHWVSWRATRVFNTSRPEWNAQNFADNTFKRIFLYENCCILIQISLKCVP